MKTLESDTRQPLEQPVAIHPSRRLFSIGLPKCNDPAEKRFPITPEGAAMLVQQGFEIKMELGAAATIHYTDSRYTRAGVRITDRNDAMGCDIVIHLAPLTPADIKRLRRGAVLLTLLSLCRQNVDSVHALLDRHVIAIALDLIKDDRGHTPFADILAEIDGRAAIARASALLADSVHGKGILLGGIAGIGPCEVTVIGSGIAARASALSASGAGAMVRMFDHDVYQLRDTTRELGSWIITSALHPKVLHNALRSADVVVYTGTNPIPVIDTETVNMMKRGVIIFDLTLDCGKAFPSLPTIDLALASPLDLSPTDITRACYVNAGSSVPRTAAMALSNSLITLMSKIVDCEGMTNALKLLPGLQCAAYTFLGKPVNSRIAAIAGLRHVDINIYLTLS